jgi:hypothetical protein
MPKLNNTTNYSQAEISRRLKVRVQESARKVGAMRKAEAASKKINSTWIGNKKTTPKKINTRATMNKTMTKSSAQTKSKKK